MEKTVEELAKEHVNEMYDVRHYSTSDLEDCYISGYDDKATEKKEPCKKCNPLFDGNSAEVDIRDGQGSSTFMMERYNNMVFASATPINNRTERCESKCFTHCPFCGIEFKFN